MAKMKKKIVTTTDAARDAETLDLSYIAGVKSYSHSGKYFGHYLKLIIHLPYYPAIALLGIYARKTKTYPHKNLHINALISFICNS